MSYFDIFKKIIEEKKEKGLKKHSFGTRKLAVGLVSCILGFNLVFSPFVTNAETDPEFFGDDDIDKVAIVNKKQTIVEASQIVEIEVVPTYYGEWIKVDDRELNLMGLSFNKVNGKYLITGKYNLREAWGQDEEQKRIVETINVIRQDGSVETRKLVFIVQRDTDRDGIPDLTDLDDDNDGYTDVEERAKGSNPKDASSVPPIVISPIDDKTVIEGKPIAEIPVTIDNPNATLKVKDLPSGLTYDPTTKKIGGSPQLNDWDTNEETRDFTVTVEAKDPSGNTTTKTFKITVQRDTDRDGKPDVTDPDDDNDGYTDVEEKAKGSDPKKASSIPATIVNPIVDQTVIEGKPIAEVTITTNNPNANVGVKNLPKGVEYKNGKVTGSPKIDDWGKNEETREFIVTVEAKDQTGTITTKTFKITVQRDTDKDGLPDVTDPDDDNDGFTDVEEKAKGTDPKSQNSKPDTGKKIDTARIAGRDRIDTAIDISKKFFKKSKAVIVVRHDLFPDSMTASVLAKLKDAPILLNPTDKLDSRVADEIKRLGAEEVIIVGGQNSVSERVREDLKAFDADKNVERIAGADRYGTSEMVAKRVVGITGKKNTAVLASGQLFPDALSVGTFASREGYPILLVKKNLIPEEVERAIRDLDINKTYIAGGLDTISRLVEAKLPNVVERMAGKTRYETSVAIAKSKFKDSKEAFIASGEEFADALVISPISGKYNLPTLLVSSRANGNQEVKAYIKDSKINKLVAIGGHRYIPSSIIDRLVK
nr:cell wall-binding repeat-containing protein [uncultured Peptostreptococcus sp.]